MAHLFRCSSCIPWPCIFYVVNIFFFFFFFAKSSLFCVNPQGLWWIRHLIFQFAIFFLVSQLYSTVVQSKPCKMFAATLQPSWPSRPQTKGTLLFYFLKLYNFVFYEIFVGSTSSEVQHPWTSKITTEPKKSRKNRFSGSILKCF